MKFLTITMFLCGCSLTSIDKEFLIKQIVLYIINEIIIKKKFNRFHKVSINMFTSIEFSEMYFVCLFVILCQTQHLFSYSPLILVFITINITQQMDFSQIIRHCLSHI